MEKEMEFIFDSAGRLLEASRKNESLINSQVVKLNRLNSNLSNTINRLEEIEENIDYTIENSLRRNAKDISQDIIREILGDFKKTNELAIEASETYKKSIKWSVWKLFLFALFLFSLTITPILVYYEYYVSNKIEEMKITVNKLKLLGGELNVQNCNHKGEIKKCIEVIPKSGSFSSNDGREFRILKFKD